MFFVLVLASFLLTCYHDVRWQMCNAHSTVSRVHMLPTGAACFERINIQFAGKISTALGEDKLFVYTYRSNDVCRLFFVSNGDNRTNRCILMLVFQ